ncbi:hypothetical protein [Ancylobacter sp. IITR112]|uniref:hypothetical protein n=1 Tax=Ancylobacter sp. IITR112 TaxID=3138073 RepID=UPI00352B3314
MRALIDHLPDYSSLAPRPAASPAARPNEPAPALAPPATAAPAAPRAPIAPAAPPAPDLSALLQEAEAAGRAAGEAAARERYELQRAEDAARAQEQLTQARRAWTDAESATLAQALAEGFERLGEDLATRLGRVIAPFLAAALRERVLADMASAITRALADGTTPLLRVSGPADLLESLQARLDPRVPVCFEAGAGGELVAVAGATTFETQMQAWAARLALAQE